MQGNLQRLAETGTSSAGGADIGADGDEHAGVAGKTGTDGADQEADDHFSRQRCGEVGKLIAHKEGNGKHNGQGGNGRILARHERFRALANGIRNKAHFRRTGIVSQHRAGKKKGKNQAEQTGNQSDPEKCAATGVDGSGRALPEDSGR